MKVTREKILHRDRYTILKEIRYVDEEDTPHAWTFLERNEGKQAVVIVPVTEESGTLILIRQYRVPFRQDVIEFPAGLMDKDERPEEAAARELLEETGFSGRITESGPEVSTSAGLTTERVRIIRMTVGETPARSQNLEGSERIQVLRIAPGTEREFLQKMAEEGVILDAKVYLWLSRAAGLIDRPIPPGVTP
jgi:ADP-ribose pyrophosphatase